MHTTASAPASRHRRKAASKAPGARRGGLGQVGGAGHPPVELVGGLSSTPSTNSSSPKRIVSGTTSTPERRGCLGGEVAGAVGDDAHGHAENLLSGWVRASAGCGRGPGWRRARRSRTIVRLHQRTRKPAAVPMSTSPTPDTAVVRTVMRDCAELDAAVGAREDAGRAGASPEVRARTRRSNRVVGFDEVDRRRRRRGSRAARAGRCGPAG